MLLSIFSLDKIRKLFTFLHKKSLYFRILFFYFLAMHRNIFSQILAGVTVASILASPFSVFADDTGLESEASTQVEVEASSTPAVPVESVLTETANEVVSLAEVEGGAAVTSTQDSPSEKAAKSVDSTEVTPQEATSNQESATIEVPKTFDQPSMIADRSNEGQSLTQGTTFRGGEKKQTKKFYTSGGFDFNVKFLDDGTIDMDSVKAIASMILVNPAPTKAEIVVMNGEEILMITNDKSTKVFFANSNSIFKNAFGGKNLLTDTVKVDFDLSEGVTVSWKKALAFPANKDQQRYNAIKKDGKIIGYTVKLEGIPKSSNYVWAFVPSKKYQDEQNTAPVPTIKTATFYTSNDKAFPVAMKDDGTVDVEASKKLLENELANITNEKDKKDAEEFIAYAGAAAELLEVEGKMLLFIKTNDHTTKVFHKEAGTHLKDSFKHSAATEGTLPADADITKAIAPAWIADADKADIAYFHAVNEGYTLLTKSGHWFYAPKKDPETTPFYTSNNKEFPVVLQNEMTVDLPASKKLLEKALPTITNPEDKKAAEDFIANATDADVEIKKIHNQRILFVKTDPGTTKVFRDSKDPLFQNAFRNTQATKGAPVDADIAQAIAPNWISDAEKGDITHSVTIGNDGYTLLTKTGHWFYAPLKLNIVHFYGSNNGELEVVMKDENTVDLIQTKKRLEPKIPLLPANLQEEARDFADNATDADVVIKEIEGVKLLFVKTSKHTKVFRSPDTDTMFQNAFKAGTEMNNDVVYADNVVKPDWVDITKKVTHYNEIKKADKVIGYALKTEDKHWFYAPVAHRVNFEMDGAAAIADQIIPLNGKAIKPTNPSKTGYRFDGWFADKAFKTAFDFTKTITEHTTVYAKWTRNSTGGGSSGSSGGSSGSSGGGSATVTTTPLTPKEVTPEVKGDEQVRNKVLFPSFAKSCDQAVLDLTDSRLVAYYADLQVQNAANVHRSLTRAEFLKLVLNAAQVDVSTESAPDYTDVTETHTLAGYIAYATRAGIVSGMNGKFRPNDTITRAEAAKIFVNVAGIKPSLNVHTFADVDAASSLAGYIQAAYDNCLLNGRKTLGGETLLENGSRVYEPEAPITLAETAKVLYNIVH